MSTPANRLIRICAAASMTLVPTHFAAAASSGSSSSSGSTETTTVCTNGKIWSKDKKQCVAPEAQRTKKGKSDKKTERLPDDTLYEAAREFAYAGQYKNALRALRAAENQNDPRILNYYGYTYRKLGNVQLGMKYYHKALKIDPDYILARSYMGQALIDQGDIQGARVQLVEIRDRGGENTWAYRALWQSLDGERGTY
ncbi:tetratricopeptide repeat protein [Sinorhizobium sp. BG8]|uniref:tetratricopeptide repeat protein n=1 Tax=Sinorhizobium sp. BG8 TaxID=2613773 RepID=UPI00193D6D98|nr:tetratricopeptide repeat protein [Sinorhizobium sp. BG8]QRM56309.1 tetratricopeptide repeat protein [Sinorhizobium sp. BG8]